MKRSKHLFRLSVTLILMAAMLISSPKSIVRAAETADKVSVSLIGKYDSADTAAIRDIDTVRKQIRFRNHSTGKTYTLSYDNTSMIYDARGEALSAALLEVGQIVDVTFLKSTRHVTTLNVSNEAWTVENTRDHELVRGDGTAKVKGEIYKIDNRTLVMADGNLALAEDVLSTDTVTVSGIGKEIYSVMVTGGHGYVSLSSDTVEDHSLVGAWIELDNEVIYKISPNMLLSAPEGDYNLQILGNGASYQQEVNISRNQETVVDTSNVNITKPKEGLVTFDIIPDTAEVFVDGEKVLTGVPQSIRYGYHSLKIVADGYVTQDKYLKIGTPKSVISIELEKDSASDSASTGVSAGDISGFGDSGANSTSIGVTVGDVSNLTSSAATTASTVSANSSEEKEKPGNKVIEGYKLYFDKPYGAELYFDGAYVGMIPASVTKISGTHEVILKQEGYETKSYRISVDSDKVDLNYTFPDLVKIEKDDDSSSSSSAASSASSSSSADDSSSSDSASTDDSSSEGDSGSSSDSSSAEDSSAAEDSSGGTGASDASTDSNSEAPSEDASAEVSGSTNSSEGKSSKDDASDAASTGSSTDKEEASDAASDASGG